MRLNYPQTLISYIRNKYLRNLSIEEQLIYKNTLLSAFAKALRIILNFIQVPITLSMIGVREYGIWLTIFSVINFISVMDIGIANGFKNKLVEALSIPDKIKAKQIVSTTYVLVAVIYGIIALLFISLSNQINWYKLLNISRSVPDINSIINIAFAFIALSFIANLFNQFLSAMQRNSYADVLGTVTEGIILVLLLTIKYIHIEPTLLKIVIIYSCVPFVVLFIANIYAFNYPYRDLRPSMYAFKRSTIKDIAGLGIKFFVIQVAGLIIFQTQILFIAKRFGTDSAAVFQLNYRYFSFSLILIAIFATPYYAMITKAYAQKNTTILRQSIRNLTKIWVGVVVTMLLMLCFSPYVFTIWLGNKVSIPLELSVLTVVWFIFHHWCVIYCSILTSVNRLNLQVFVAVLEAICSILLINYFAQNYQLLSVPLTNITILFVNSIILYFQVRKLKFQNHLIVL
jgi:O-antigen/teichoic acid export membrane protein